MLQSLFHIKKLSKKLELNNNHYVRHTEQYDCRFPYAIRQHTEFILHITALDIALYIPTVSRLDETGIIPV